MSPNSIIGNSAFPVVTPPRFGSESRPSAMKRSRRGARRRDARSARRTIGGYVCPIFPAKFGSVIDAYILDSHASSLSTLRECCVCCVHARAPVYHVGCGMCGCMCVRDARARACGSRVYTCGRVRVSDIAVTIIRGKNRSRSSRGSKIENCFPDAARRARASLQHPSIRCSV